MTLVNSCRRASETQTLACANFISAKMNRLQKKKFSHEKFHGMKNCSRDNVTHIGLTQPARVQSQRDPRDEL